MKLTFPRLIEPNRILSNENIFPCHLLSVKTKNWIKFKNAREKKPKNNVELKKGGIFCVSRAEDKHNFWRVESVCEQWMEFLIMFDCLWHRNFRHSHLPMRRRSKWSIKCRTISVKLSFTKLNFQIAWIISHWMPAIVSARDDQHFWRCPTYENVSCLFMNTTTLVASSNMKSKPLTKFHISTEKPSTVNRKWQKWQQ